MTRSPFRIDQPQPNDLIGDPLLVAGTGGGFEATIDIRVLDGDGDVLLQTSAQVAPSTEADEPEARVSIPELTVARRPASRDALGDRRRRAAVHRRRLRGDLRGET